MQLKKLETALALVLGVAVSTAWAGDLPQVHHSGDISYVSGGVGEEHAQAMEAVRKDYPLSMLFVRKDTPRNAYLADIAVTIRNAQGKVVLQTTSEGPFLFVKMPAGRYAVSATHENSTRSARVYVPQKGHKHLVFEWSQ